MRAALYARYSDERQNPRSVADQLAELTRHAERRGWTIVAVFTDAAISGAAMANRPGLLSLLAAAEAGGFDVVLVEDTDRLARNREHDAHVYNRLTRAGVAIATPTTDKVGVIDSALRGLMNELYLVNLGAKTSRGMRENAERGLATGSRTYGYRSQLGGAMAIVPAEAEVIRECYRRYAPAPLGAGETARDIAADLNRRGVAGPTGGAWNASTLNGSRQRGNGILRCALYAGVKLWNRLVITKDPDTGRRTSRPRPEAEWRRTEVPELAIVPRDLFDAVAARKAAEGAGFPLQLGRRRAGSLLTGLTRCGCCGASYTTYNAGRLICAGHRERGPAACANRRTIARAEVEARVLAALQTRLLAPDAVALYMAEYRAAWAAAAGDRTAERRQIDKRLAELKRRSRRIVEGIAEGRASNVKAERDLLFEYEAEMDTLEARATALAADAARQPAELHPAAPAAYAALVARLAAHLGAAPGTPEAREERDAFRALVLSVTVTPLGQARGDPFAITLTGDLARFLPEQPANQSRRRVVAGGRFSASPTMPVTIAA